VNLSVDWRELIECFGQAYPAPDAFLIRVGLAEDLIPKARNGRDQWSVAVPMLHRHGLLGRAVDRACDEPVSARHHDCIRDAWARLEATLTAVPDPIAPPELQRYLHRIEQEHRDLQLLGVMTRKRVPVPLDGLYVPLDAHLDLTLRGAEVYDSEGLGFPSEARHDFDRSGGTVSKPLCLIDAFRKATSMGRRGVVLLGDPGSGKTTHLKQTLLKVKRDGSASLGLPTGIVPVFLPLRNLRESIDLRSFMARELEGMGTERDFGHRLFERDRLLVLLDGLDEVADEDERMKVSRWIEQALLRQLPDSYVLVTCRYAGYKGHSVELDARFLQLQLRPMDDAQMETFVRNWYASVERQFHHDDEARAKEKASTGAHALLAALTHKDFTHPRLFGMTRNPLLLTTICLVHRDSGRLPRDRARLYEESIKVLLERWRDRFGEIPLSTEQAFDVMQSVAKWMHTEPDRTFALKEELVGPVDSALARQRGVELQAGEFLQATRDHAGLLTGWSMNEYRFMHLGLQEFLTAQWFRNEGLRDPKQFEWLAARFGESWWEEVILLMLALHNPAVFEEFMRAVVRQPGFEQWAQSQVMERALEETAKLSAAPFEELLRLGVRGESSVWARFWRAMGVGGSEPALVPRQLAAARLLGRVMPKALAGVEALLRDHSNQELRTWWKERVGRGATVRTRMSPRGGVELVFVPGGTFTMGSPEDEGGRLDDEGPQHEVELAGFYLARTAVTNAQYAAFVSANPEYEKPEYWADSRYNQPEQPVVGVSWEDAKAYCEWAGLVLPTEAQWEYACRAGTTTAYSTGEDEAALARTGWYVQNSQGRPHAVGQKEPNEFGLYDMHGNVWEWCLDAFESYGVSEPRHGDGSRKEPVGDASRVLRGGCWDNPARLARSAYRNHVHPGLRYVSIGFRPAQGIH